MGDDLPSIFADHPYAQASLPTLVTRPVFHYTSAAAAHAIIETKTLFASHIETMNDPNERLYGRQLIAAQWREREEILESKPAALAAVIDEVFNHPRWLDAPQSYVLSASTRSDHLDQYRLYGHYSLGLRPVTWAVQLLPGAHPKHVTARWRKVVYDPTEASQLIENMFQSAIRAAQDGSLDQPLAARWFDHLAAHLKSPAFESEQEARLVFASTREERIARTRVVEGTIRPYTEVQPEAGLHPVTEVWLGPMANRDIDRLGMQYLLAGQRLAGNVPPIEINVTEQRLR